MSPEKISEEQIDILLKFAERCKHLCFGRLPRNPNSKVDAYSQWASVAKVLNYSEKGPRKSVVEWKACWTEMKNKAKCKVNQARHKSRFSRIEVLPKLSPYETRIIELSEQAAEEQRMKLSTSSNEGSDAEESHTTPEVQKQSEITPKLEQTNKSQPHVQLPRVTLTRQIQSVSDCRNEHVDRLSKAINTLAESHTAIAVSQENMASSHRAIADALQALRNVIK